MNYDRFEIRPFRPGDEARVLALHNRAFSGHQPRSRAHFDWKFLQNPAGPPEISMALEGDRCVAVYASTPIRCILRGRAVLAGLQTDVGVDPEMRRGLAGTRLLIHLCRDFTRTFVLGRKAIEWGFPEPMLQRVTVRHLGVHVLRDLNVLVLRAGLAPASVPTIEVERVPAVPAAVDALWQRCAPANGASTVRDVAYLTWRYARHPDVAHVFLAARSGDLLRGFAVLREDGPHDRATAIMDWLVPDTDRDAERALLARAAAVTADRGRSYLAAWVPLAMPQAMRWQEDLGFRVASTPHQECYRSWTPGIGRRWLSENWHRSLGDVDFF